jgi:hypothetical protein
VCIKATNDYVYLQANLSTGDTNAAQYIQWSGGEAVPGNPFQHRVSKSTSAKTTVTATLGTNSFTKVVWVVWATVSPKFSGSLSSDDPLNFPAWCSGNALGPWNDIPTSPPAQVGYKVELVGKITPSGAGAIVKTGWAYSQNVSLRTWFNSTNYTDSSGADSWDANFEDDTPSSKDQIFLIDCPSDGSNSGTAFFKANWNFITWITWNGQIASDNALWNVRVKAHPSNGSYIIDTCTAGSGNPSFDTSY